MTKKTLGYVELEWPCPNCGTRNPGPQKFCNGCGAPQPEDVQFEQPAQEKLLTDEKKIARAQAGPDIHCPYCGARNPGNAKFCGACGGDLAEGKRRQAGKVLGAHRAAPAPPKICPACGAENPAEALNCRQCGGPLPAQAPSAPTAAAKKAGSKGRSALAGLIIGGVVLLCAAGAILFLVLSRRTETLTGVVQGVQWTRSVQVEALLPVEREAWLDEVPAEGELGSCRQEVRYTSEDPEPNSEEVCGTPYTVDSGSGFGEVVQDCVYEVYDDFCTYTIDEWQVVDTVTLSGQDLNPRWPEPTLTVGQRVGEGEEKLLVVFETDQGSFNYAPPDVTTFSQFQPGSRWILEVNTFNRVVGVEAAQ